MTPVCTCARPIVRDFPNSPGHQVCKKCGHWYSVKHGSIDPDAPRSIIFDEIGERDAAPAKTLPPLMRVNRGRTGGKRRAKR